MAIRKNFSKRVVWHWNKLPIVVEGSPFQEVLKNHRDVVYRDIV